MNGVHGTTSDGLSSGISAALERLQTLLPLVARQVALPADWRAVHQAILRGFILQAQPPCHDELRQHFPALDITAVLARLVAEDLIVCEHAGQATAVTIRGAYPFTLEMTPHRVRLGGRQVQAMCAVDALAVAHLCGAETELVSHCAQSAQPVRVHQVGETLLKAFPATLRVGIAWQATGGCAAHSLCRDMVFLADAVVARDWRRDRATHEVLSLDAAVSLGAAFFGPLLA